ncbi:RNA polymerase sigma factor [Pseudaminobacter sp. 19-2017]|uniref:RNA polymerase sigma factor n=1 Tax=Pseudaminobacter soli (ex Zhang et al. 2022) TaxID=2831468 RepID=A0A942I192_9HYPH|nr:RNA polymerase sigma factor [Pseudaminobacter soli]MBS3647342.1 RNA polymerase sigma factor [Pseudaminobacter soli]
MQAAQANTAEHGPHGEEMALVSRALARDDQAFRTIMKRNNRRLYHIARAVIRDDAEAEDVVQEAYVRAFSNLAAFRGGSSLSTWLSRITINEALGRLRSRRRAKNARLDPSQVVEAEIIRFPGSPDAGDPERTIAQRQILRLVEQAADKLPDGFRTVFVARVIEGMSVEETADLLQLQPQTVKTRLHRARSMVRKELQSQIGAVLLDAFPFAGRRCARLTSAVMRRLGFSV